MYYKIFSLFEGQIKIRQYQNRLMYFSETDIADCCFIFRGWVNKQICIPTNGAAGYLKIQILPTSYR